MTRWQSDEGTSDRPDSGFALVVVIWLIGLLAIFVLSFSQGVRVHVGMASNTSDRIIAEALADAGIELAAMRLLATAGSGSQVPPLFDGEPTLCRLPEGSRLELSIRDTAGLVDINVASEETLRALFQGVGLEKTKASQLAAAVLDYRDADDQTRPGGAEIAEYRAAGLRRGPRNGPFRSIDEIGSVLSAPAPLLERLRPYLTVRSGQRGVDPRVARSELMAVLRRGHGDAEPDVAGDVSAIAEPVASRRELLPSSLRSASARLAVVATATVTTRSGAVFVREAVLGLQRPIHSATSRVSADLSKTEASPVGRGQVRPLGVVTWDWRIGTAPDNAVVPATLQPC